MLVGTEMIEARSLHSAGMGSTVRSEAFTLNAGPRLGPPSPEHCCVTLQASKGIESSHWVVGANPGWIA
jgi:hypothetical protein